MIKVNKVGERVSGILLAVLIAIFARWVESVLPVNFIGATILAIFLGVLVNSLYPIKGTTFESGVQFTSNRVLKFAIILLGGSLDISTISEVGRITLLVLIFTLLTAFGGGFLLGKWMGLDWKFTSLISSGAGICGGSAISAVAPVIEAEDQQVSYAMSNVFIFDMIMILLFPILGHTFDMSNMIYGLWAGTAINDTSSVVAAGYAFNEAAGDFATMVKLTRTLAIIPVVLIFTVIQIRNSQKVNKKSRAGQIDINLVDIFPWFIVGFLVLVILYSIGTIPEELSVLFKELSRFLIVTALAAIGLKTDIGAMKKAGLKPMIHGITISLLVVFVSFGVLVLFGIH